MIKKLLNKNNLIIVLITIIVTLLIVPPQNVFAAELQLSDYLSETVASWYVFIKGICIAVMIVALIAIGIKAALSSSPDDKADIKMLFLYWIIGIIILIFLEQIIYAVIYLEQIIVDRLRQIAQTIAGSSTPDQEISLYESARTKAYEIKFTSGMLGLFMYIILVYYTFKFFFIYLKRYVNVMILIIASPIVISVNTYRKAFQGKGGLIGKWIKEFLYNVFIQVVHAGVYSTIIAFALTLSDDALSFIGAIITFLALFFMCKLDGIIRKIFNFVGGSSTVEVRDYKNIIKHPIDTVYDTKEYVTETLPGEIKGKAEDLAENFAPEKLINGGVKFANNFKNSVKENLEAIDGKKVKVTAEEIRKEQHKIDNPNAIQKVFNTVQKLAIGAVGAAITGTEKLAKKVKEKIKKLDEATKKAREELNQDSEMIKRFAKILKFHAKRKLIKQRVENNEEESDEEKLQSTFLNVLDNPEQEVLELRESINQSYDDIVAIVYGLQGPAVFINPEIGSSYMGMSVLASARYERRAVSEEIETSSKKIISFPRKRLANQKLENAISSKEAKKVYKFKRFNHSSVQTITSSLNRRFVMNNEYLANLYQVNQMVANGDIQVSGSYIPKDYSGIRKTSIKYTAKLKSHKEHKSVADITFGRYSAPKVREEEYEAQKGKIISFNGAKTRKAKSQAIINTYQERIQDSNWAILESMASDVKEVHNNQVLKSVQKVNQRTNTEVVLQQLTDMGQAVKINNESYLFLSNDSIDENIKQIEGTSQEETNQAIIDNAIINLAVGLDIPLEEIDLRIYEEAKEKLIDDLIQKGLVENSVKSNPEEKEKLVDVLETRKEDIVQKHQETYVSSVMKKAAANILVKTVNASDKAVDKAKEIGSILHDKATENKFINNDYTKVLGQIAKGAVETEAERVKQDLLSQVQSAVDYTNDSIKTAKEIYGITREDIEKKGEQIKEDTKNFAIGVEEKAAEAVRAVVDTVTNPIRFNQKKNKNDESNGDDDSRELFLFTIEGAIAVSRKIQFKIKCN